MFSAELLLEKDDRTGRLRFRTRGNRLLVLFGLVVVGVLLYGLVMTGYRVAISYGAYEGTVVALDRDWLSTWFGDDTTPKTQLTIQTPAGDRIRRYASDHMLEMNRIEIGDYVVKRPGFFEPPRPRDKQTLPEMLEQFKQDHPAALP